MIKSRTPGQTNATSIIIRKEKGAQEAVAVGKITSSVMPGSSGRINSPALASHPVLVPFKW